MSAGESKKYSLKKYQLIHVVEREYPAYQVSLFGRGMCDARRFKKFLEIPKAFRVYVCHNNNYQTGLADEQQMKQALRRAHDRDPKYLDRVARRCYAVGRVFDRWTVVLARKDFSRSALRQLYQNIHRFSELCKNVSVFLQYMVYIDHLLKEELEACRPWPWRRGSCVSIG